MDDASGMNEQIGIQRAQLAVYLVDDDPAIRDSISLSLSLRGYHIAQFSSAEDFLHAYDAAWTGCVAADIRMPGMSGLQLQTELSARGSRLPVVIITGHDDVASASAAFRGNAIDFLEKPFDDEQLTTAIALIDKAWRNPDNPALFGDIAQVVRAQHS